MVQRLFADVIHDAIWFMNIHEQNHPWFLAMSEMALITSNKACWSSTKRISSLSQRNTTCSRNNIAENYTLGGKRQFLDHKYLMILWSIMYNVQDYSVLYNNADAGLCVRVGILLTRGKH
jgi:hypothetical protein